MKLVFFGDSVWATHSLRALVEAGHEIGAVIGRKTPMTDCLEQEANALGLNYEILESVNAPEATNWLKGHNAQLGVSVSYDQIFRPATTESFPLGIINAHAGSLPKYRGRNVINWALINNESELGITIHCVNEGIDTGDILVQHSLPITWEDDYATLLERAYVAIPPAVLEAVNGLAHQSISPRPQPFWSGTFFTRRRPGDEWINWQATSLEIYNFVRAITRPGPGARTLCNSRELTIWKVLYDPEWIPYQARPGEVVGKTPDGAPIVKTGDSVVVLLDVTWEQEPYKLKPGHRFSSKQP